MDKDGGDTEAAAESDRARARRRTARAHARDERARLLERLSELDDGQHLNSDDTISERPEDADVEVIAIDTPSPMQAAAHTPRDAATSIGSRVMARHRSPIPLITSIPLASDGGDDPAERPAHSAAPTARQGARGGGTLQPSAHLCVYL